METLSGAIERITYYNPENGYTVLRLRPDSTCSLVYCFTALELGLRETQ